MYFSTVKEPKALAVLGLGAMGIPSLRNSQGRECFDLAALMGCRNQQREQRASPVNKIMISTTGYLEKEWMAINTNVYLGTLVQGEHLSVTKPSEFLTKELLPQAANMLQQFRDTIKRNMLEPKPWIHSKTLYSMVTDKKPFINSACVGFFVNNIWPMAPYTSNQCNVSIAMNLFLWFPADQQSKQYLKEEGDIVTEQSEAQMSQGKAKVGCKVPVLAKCKEPLDVFSALLWMSSAVATITTEMKEYTPALGLLCNMGGGVVHTREMRSILSDEPENEELLCHLLLHKLQDIFSSYICDSVNHNHKHTVDIDGYISSQPFNKATMAIYDRQTCMQGYKTSNMSDQGLVTLKRNSPAPEAHKKQVCTYSTLML